ncbi:DUF6473 family protein [Aestuariibius sp. 2305UL40-4]|uniref:DUF6473 family protein n=1 Tax=Aestuariibius violaceus TaxID=3234132 RepID=UPI00345EC2AF
MLHDPITAQGLDYAPCHYGTSRLRFRGPQAAPSPDALAFVGGIETFGRFTPDPFTTQIARMLGRPCLNLGVPNAGPDLLLGDPSLIDICNNVAATILQIPGALNLSNRFYSVHPRRNDRFTGASEAARAAFPKIDFTEFTFTRHLIGTLWRRDPRAFTDLRQELQQAWVDRMTQLIAQIETPLILLWLSDTPPRPSASDKGADPLTRDPALVSQEMMARIAPPAAALVTVLPTEAEIAKGQTGLVVPTAERTAANRMLGTEAHRMTADALTGVLEQIGLGALGATSNPGETTMESD